MRSKVETKYDYGKCEICDTPMEPRLIKQNFWIRGEFIVVEDVPAGVCPQCGEKVVRADVGHWLEELLKNADEIAKAPRISVPSIKFDIEVAAI
ncbi:YgiT-type zinc finger protein [candidate division KSB1 bacterium]|nr:MAG: YgiT-type zinc finger protein [candidate division KSB1 bacterium]